MWSAALPFLLCYSLWVPTTGPTTHPQNIHAALIYVSEWLFLLLSAFLPCSCCAPATCTPSSTTWDSSTTSSMEWLLPGRLSCVLNSLTCTGQSRCVFTVNLRLGLCFFFFFNLYHVWLDLFISYGCLIYSSHCFLFTHRPIQNTSIGMILVSGFHIRLSKKIENKQWQQNQTLSKKSQLTMSISSALRKEMY